VEGDFMAKENKAVSKPASAADNGKTCAILAYLLVGIIWYFADENMKKSSLAKYHTKQALVLLIVDIVLVVAASILGMILVWIPIIGFVFMSLIWFAVSIGIFILWVLGIINAVNAVEKPLPVIGHFSDKLTF
jgi:uncharacterized membrane protein